MEEDKLIKVSPLYSFTRGVGKLLFVQEEENERVNNEKLSTYLLMMISIRRLTSAWNSNFSALAASFSLSAGVKDEAAASGEGTTVGAAALSEEESSADTKEASLTNL